MSAAPEEQDRASDARSSGVNGEGPPRKSTPEPVAARMRPRVWTVFAAFPIVFVVYLLAQVVGFGVGAAVTWIVSGEMPDATTLLDSPAIFLTAIGVAQLAFLSFAIIAGMLSPEPIRERLAMRPMLGPIWSLPLFAIGTLFVASMSVLLLTYLSSGPSEHMATLSELLLAPTGLALAMLFLTIGIMPGIAEEFLFRGYFQSRLLKRWHPAIGIAIASVMFAALHIDPQHMLAALLLGVWCGIVAWRTMSVWPAVICHATNNTAAIIMTRILMPYDAPDDIAVEWAVALPPGWFVYGITLPCFALSLVVLFGVIRHRQRADAAEIAAST